MVGRALGLWYFVFRIANSQLYLLNLSYAAFTQRHLPAAWHIYQILILHASAKVFDIACEIVYS